MSAGEAVGDETTSGEVGPEHMEGGGGSSETARPVSGRDARCGVTVSSFRYRDVQAVAPDRKSVV